MNNNKGKHSFEFFEDRPVKLRGCDRPGCSSAGDYRAPKSRELTEYYWFCLEHVRDYNKAWDYFAGMPSSAIEQHIRNATVWERPTWPLGEWQKREDELRTKLDEDFFGGTGDFHTRTEPPVPPQSSGERDALAILELTAPVTFVEIKSQYRTLVKQHHPDVHGGSREAEEKFKNINQAFAVLKQIYSVEEAT